MYLLYVRYCMAGLTTVISVQHGNAPVVAIRFCVRTVVPALPSRTVKSMWCTVLASATWPKLNLLHSNQLQEDRVLWHSSMRITISRLSKSPVHLHHPRRSLVRQYSPVMADLTINSTYRMPSGYDIPILGFGVYQTPADMTSEVVQYAIEAGYRHIDSAVAYRNEGQVAEGIKKSGIPRNQVFFTTKVPYVPMTSLIVSLTLIFCQR